MKIKYETGMVFFFSAFCKVSQIAQLRVAGNREGKKIESKKLIIVFFTAILPIIFYYFCRTVT